MPCQDYLAQLREHERQFEARGAVLVGVGGAADYQARNLRETKGIDFPLLLDPEGRLRGELAITTKLDSKEMASWASARNYIRSLRRARQGRVSQPHAQDRPAIVILDADLNVVWGKVGQALGDYPSVAEVLTAIPS